jgi:hypothetical protein
VRSSSVADLAAALACLVAAVPLIGCGSDGSDGGPADMAPFHPTACNGAAALCDRRYDAVAYPTTHNAFSTVAGNFGAANQTYDMPRQLADGVRGLMLDTYYFLDEFNNRDTFLCHGLCQIGSQKLVDGLGQIRAFLDANRAEVVTIIFESYISAADSAAAFDRSDLRRYVVPHHAGEPWPTLRQLIERNQRLVVFSAGDATTSDPSSDWFLDEFTWCWENPYQNTTIDDFRCNANRGSTSNDLFVLNHFLEDVLPHKDQAEQANVDPGFTDHVHRCRTETGRFPNFPTVDFYEVGVLFAVTAALNGTP